MPLVSQCTKSSVHWMLSWKKLVLFVAILEILKSLVPPDFTVTWGFPQVCTVSACSIPQTQICLKSIVDVIRINKCFRNGGLLLYNSLNLWKAHTPMSCVYQWHNTRSYQEARAPWDQCSPWVGSKSTLLQTICCWAAGIHRILRQGKSL